MTGSKQDNHGGFRTGYSLAELVTLSERNNKYSRAKCTNTDRRLVYCTPSTSPSCRYPKARSRHQSTDKHATGEVEFAAQTEPPSDRPRTLPPRTPPTLASRYLNIQSQRHLGFPKNILEVNARYWV
ncbi:hypothetical protein J6590_040227 [Homalodisca vitripennis]|nr:hypothetical protein J6590_040227 [Homalodisca vitripennis]